MPEIDFRDVQAVLFDFDGTLAHLNIDFARTRTEAEQVLRRYGLSTKEKASLHTLELVEDAVQVLAERSGWEAAEALRREAEAAIVAAEVAAAEEADAYPGVPELLRRLQEQGIRVAIVTRNCRAAVERILRRSPLPCNVLLTRDDVDAVKPAADHLLAALRRLGVEPCHALMVGDHPLDVRAGSGVGARSVAVLGGEGPPERFAPEHPDLIVEHVRELGAHMMPEA